MIECCVIVFAREGMVASSRRIQKSFTPLLMAVHEGRLCVALVTSVGHYVVEISTNDNSHSFGFIIVSQTRLVRLVSSLVGGIDYDRDLEKRLLVNEFAVC